MSKIWCSDFFAFELEIIVLYKLFKTAIHSLGAIVNKSVQLFDQGNQAHAYHETHSSRDCKSTRDINTNNIHKYDL